MSDTKPRGVRQAVLYSVRKFNGTREWEYRSPDDGMRLIDQFTNYSGFLVTKAKRSKKLVTDYLGTAFIVAVPSETYRQDRYYYVVTAKHLLEDENSGEIFAPLPPLYLRLNTKDGRREDIKLGGEWHYHDDPTVDVAVMPIEPPDPAYYEYETIPYSPRHEDRDNEYRGKNDFADKTLLRAWWIGISDDLRIVGLFTEHKGDQRNEPIVRSGIISAMPRDGVEFVKNGKVLRVNAYIAEVRSIGGLSGAPVFVIVNEYRNPDVPREPKVWSSDHRSFFLGMVRGHWDEVRGGVLPKLRGEESVNMGMALITPADDILAILLGDAMKEQRKKDDEETPRRAAFKHDSALKRPRKTPAQEITPEGFDDALRKVFPKPSPSASKRKRT